jgi:DNA-binding PadR family transcriptional regulator
MKKETKTALEFQTHAPADSEQALLKLFKDGLMDIYWAKNHGRVYRVGVSQRYGD